MAQLHTWRPISWHIRDIPVVALHFLVPWYLVELRLRAHGHPISMCHDIVPYVQFAPTLCWPGSVLPLHVAISWHIRYIEVHHRSSILPWYQMRLPPGWLSHGSHMCHGMATPVECGTSTLEPVFKNWSNYTLGGLYHGTYDIYRLLHYVSSSIGTQWSSL